MTRSAAFAFLLACVAVPAASQTVVLPGARLSNEPGAGQAPAVPFPVDPGGPGARPAGEAAPARIALPRPISEDSILGRELRLNGTTGSFRLERIGRTEHARITLRGNQISAPADECELVIDGSVPLTARGRPDGLPRYELQASSCPMVIDVLEGAIWVRGPAPACVVRTADCQADVRGIWGPPPQGLVAQAKLLEESRAAAEKAVRESYRALSQRAAPQEARAVVAEQAAFSSERETLCRAYAGEATHGFCNARFTEARAAQLAGRLGLVPAPPPATAAAPGPAQARRPGPVTPPMSLLPNQE